MRRTILAAAVLVAFGTWLAAVPAPPPAAAQAGAPLPMRIGYQTNSDWLTIAARTHKLFEKAGLACDALEKDRMPSIKVFAEEAGIKGDWAATIYRWAEPQYPFSVVRDSPFLIRDELRKDG
ncbi:MAG: hypothetical protein HYV93_08710 [Candidatus Rokubacteria bacterium]|nr:hypothetical protein [Candidatus Rokubacteria bacterium]